MKGQYIKKLISVCTSVVVIGLCITGVYLKTKNVGNKEDFEKFRNEVLIFCSDEDKIFCDNLKDALVNLMPNPVVRKLEGGHLAMAVDAQKYLAELDEFLS